MSRILVTVEQANQAFTAIVYNLTLVTHNSDDFKNIQGLKILNPF